MERLAHKPKHYMFVYLLTQLFIYVYYMQLLLTLGEGGDGGSSSPEYRQTWTSIKEVMEGGGVSQEIE